MCVCVCVYHVFIIHSCVDEHSGCICVLAVVNSAALNKRVHVSLWVTVFSRCIARSRIAGSLGNSTFSFLRNFHALFCSGCTSLCSYQQCRRVAFSLHPVQHLLFVYIYIYIFRCGVRVSAHRVFTLLQRTGSLVVACGI